MVGDPRPCHLISLQGHGGVVIFQGRSHKDCELLGLNPPRFAKRIQSLGFEIKKKNQLTNLTMIDQGIKQIKQIPSPNVPTDHFLL